MRASCLPAALLGARVQAACSTGPRVGGLGAPGPWGQPQFRDGRTLSHRSSPPWETCKVRSPRHPSLPPSAEAALASAWRRPPCWAVLWLLPLTGKSPRLPVLRSRPLHSSLSPQNPTALVPPPDTQPPRTTWLPGCWVHSQSCISLHSLCFHQTALQ